MSYAIRVEGLGKRYVINQGGASAGSSLRDAVQWSVVRLFGARRPAPLEEEAEPQAKSFWALRDISFDVMEGERIGVIGANGAGKSTLLKILSRVTAPTEGRVEILGKVASLLEVGTGFHPELSGRENVYLSGAIMGMTMAEIRRKFDRIVDFSGVEKFIDTPVKHYSSGMYVRLAFAVSAWLDPDILIVDEVLSVGDAAFQKRCAERMRELTREGRTVLFVSHSMATVNQMCQKALYLEKGQLVSFDSVRDATVEYQRDVVMQIETQTISDNEKKEAGIASEGPADVVQNRRAFRWHRPVVIMPDDRIEMFIERKDGVEFLSACVYAEGSEPSDQIRLDQNIHVTMRYRLRASLEVPIVPNFHFYDEFDGRLLVSMPEHLPGSDHGDYIAICIVPAFHFNEGRYIVMPAISSFSLSPPVHFAAVSALRFEVVETGVIDPRRHGYNGVLPGSMRARLDWSFASSPDASPDVCVEPLGVADRSNAVARDEPCDV